MDGIKAKDKHLKGREGDSVVDSKRALNSASPSSEGSSSVVPLTEVEGQFTKLCTELNVPDNVKKKTWKEWIDMLSSDMDIKSDYMPWLACLLYSAATDCRVPYGMTDPQVQALESPVFTVTKLLQKTDLGIRPFFERLRALKEHGKLSTTVKQNVLGLEKKYCIVAALYDKLEKILAQIFREETENGSYSCLPNAVPDSELSDLQQKKSLIWTAFVLTKGALDMGDSELIFSFYLLLCSIDHVLRLTPSFMLNPPFDTVRRECCENVDPYCMLKELCEQFVVRYEEVKAVCVNFWEPFLSSLPHTQGELDLTRIQTAYLQNHQKLGDINELLFLTKSPVLLPSVPNGQSSDTPKPDTVPMTPVRAALSSVQQLNEVLEGCKDTPSSELVNFFKSCTSNPQPDIEDRVRHLEERFVDGFCQVMGKNKKSISQQRYQLAVRLYYRVLEKMLKAEEDRLSRADFSTLLNNDTFHKSLLACAVEVVMAAYASTVPGNATPSSTDTAFPWVLAVFGLQAYNFHKVLESFIRAEPGLPRETIKHIQSIENQILEKIAWKSDSPLFDLLKTTEIPAPSIPVSPGVKEQPKNGGTPVTAAQLYLSPTNGLQATSKMADKAQVIASSSVRQTPPKRSHSLNLFFNKVSRLAYHRLQDLCTLLAIPKDMQLKIWTCLEHCITRKPDLLRDRHLDQVMLCSVYAIHKVISTDTELKFKTIVHMYKSMPHATQEVFKNTLISGNEYDSIIGFYNRVFMQATKNVILQFSPSRSSNPGSLTLSPVPKNIQSPLTASPVYSVPGRKNFYVSPLKSPTFKAPISPSQMTPRTRQLYSFGEGFGSSEKLKSINDTLRAMKRTSPTAVTPKSQKRLRFDQPDQDRSSANNFEEERIVVIRTSGNPDFTTNSNTAETTSNQETSQSK